MYYKGANMLHTLRQLIEDDQKWRQLLRKINLRFYHQTVTTKQIEDFISKESGIDLTQFFNQYLRDVRLPKLEFSHKKNTVKYRWTNIVDGFDMPVKIGIGKHDQKWIYPKAEWQTLEISSGKIPITIDKNFYIEVKMF